jgi:hypothetical protein
MIGDSSGLFPHFLGILSKTPAHAHQDNSGGGGGELHHPFNPRVPPLKHPGTTKKPGGRIFVEGAIDSTDNSDIKPQQYQPRYVGDKTRENNSI